MHRIFVPENKWLFDFRWYRPDITTTPPTREKRNSANKCMSEALPAIFPCNIVGKPEYLATKMLLCFTFDDYFSIIFFSIRKAIDCSQFAGVKMSIFYMIILYQTLYLAVLLPSFMTEVFTSYSVFDECARSLLSRWRTVE